MSTTLLIVLSVLDLAGLVGVWALRKIPAKRRAAGKPPVSRAIGIPLGLLALVILVAFPVLAVQAIKHPVVYIQHKHDRLVQNGTPATAVITHIEETGDFLNERPYVRVSLTVEPEGAPAFSAEWKRAFSVTDIQNYRVGTKVNVFFDPEDPSTATVVGVAPPEE